MVCQQSERLQAVGSQLSYLQLDELSSPVFVEHLHECVEEVGAALAC